MLYIKVMLVCRLMSLLNFGAQQILQSVYICMPSLGSLKSWSLTDFFHLRYLLVSVWAAQVPVPVPIAVVYKMLSVNE